MDYPSESDTISEQTFNEFIEAVKSGSLQTVQNIIRTSNPVIVNKIEPQSRHPALYFAVLVPDEDVAQQLIKLLIRNGANFKFKDHNEQTVLFYVCREGKEKCAQIFLSHGLSLDDVDGYGQTPLFYAVNQNRLEIVRKYSTKQRVNHTDNLATQTPLYYASRRGHLEMCKILIEKGADICHIDSNGKNAIELAKKSKFHEVADYLNNQYKRLKDGNKYSMMSQSIEDSKSNIQKKKKKEGSVKGSRQTYKIVFLNEKGQVKDLTEQEVRQISQTKPELQRYLASPESIPQEMFEAANLDNWQKVASKILSHICKLKGAYWFQEPVDPVKYNIMDYFDIVTKPMDLGSIRKRIAHNCYNNASQFIEEMHLIWQNCYKYNGQVHEISKCAKEIQTAFKESVNSFGLDKYIEDK